jgi:signal peptidase I
VTTPPDGAAPSAPRPRRRSRLALEILETVVLTVVLFLVIQTFIAQPFQVKQHSMERTLEPGQYVLVDKLTPFWAPYARGDIVVFRPPESDSDTVPLIKRVIGLPGDTVELRDGLVYVNGSALDEGYLYRGDDGETEPTDPSYAGMTQWLIPPGQLLVMGDHREDSSDSRAFGPIPTANVVGRAWLRYWPFDVFGVLPRPAYPELGP